MIYLSSEHDHPERHTPVSILINALWISLACSLVNRLLQTCQLGRLYFTLNSI